MMNLRSFMADVLKNSHLLSSCYNTFYKVKNGRVYKRELNHRAKLSIFSYKELAAEMPYYPLFPIADTNYYGHAYAMCRYSGCTEFRSNIEHGIFLGNRISIDERCDTIHSVIAMSPNRVESFRQHNMNKPIEAVGPYVYYAEPLLNDDELSKLKEELGKVLLIFPSHSSRKSNTAYDLNSHLDYVKKYKEEFDTILVSLHHIDIVRFPQIAEAYENIGCRIVTSGHKFDYRFLSRLRTIISLADLVIHNSIGTQIGHCAILEKKQILIMDQSMIDIIKKSDVYDNKEREIAYSQTMEIYEALREDSKLSEDEKLQILNRFYGISCVKTPDQLKKIIERLNQL